MSQFSIIKSQQSHAKFTAKVLCLFFMLASFILPLPIQATQNSASNKHTTLIASGHGEYPPFMYRDGKSIVGVGVDITKLIFAELNIKVDATFVGPWSRVQRKAKAGDIDLIVGIYKTSERLNYLAYPQEPYLAEPVGVFFYHKTAIQYKKWQDLIGIKGGTVIGESFGQDFDTYAKKNLNIMRLSSITQSFKMLKRNRLQYSIYALYPGLIKIADANMQNQIIPSHHYISTQDAYQAFSKKSAFIKHLPYFNQRVKELKADGSVEGFIQQHMKKLRHSANIEGNK